MTNTRNFLLIALLMLGFLLWQAWQQDYAVPNSASADGAASAPAATTAATPPVDDIPLVPLADVPASAVPAVASGNVESEASASAHIEVRTDKLKLVIDTRGGSLVHAELLDYPQNAKNKEQPVILLAEQGPGFFVAQSGLVSQGSPAPDHRALFKSEANRYELAAGADTLEVPLSWIDASGLTVTKTYRLHRDSYVIDLEQRIVNAGSAPWVGNEYRQLQRAAPAASSGFSLTNPEQYSFVGAAWFSPEEKFEKRTFDEFAEEPLNRAIHGGWAGMLQHYFFAAWIPPAEEKSQFSTSQVLVAGTPRYLIRSVSPAVSVAPGQSATTGARIYVGPKLQKKLAQIAPGLELTVDYGLFTIFAEPLFWLLELIHRLVGNWGFAIILLTVLIKLAFFKLSEAQYRSMAKMKRLQPRLAALKERYGEDRQKYNAAMMELYQKEKINPLGGCLPMLVQIPVFIALYWVLLESVELRQAPFIGWIKNLSAADPYFILPILNAAAMFAAQRLSPAPGADPIQQKMMQAMPIVFGVMFAFFPAGLVLYWTVNGILSLAQQYVITKRHADAPAKA